jgi:glycosyltransferase involved in cell wall biosynthesis
MDVTVVVATFGDDFWADLAERRAIPSAEALDVPVLASHGDSLHEARNAGLSDVQTEWVAFLDADDELEPGYFDAMGEGTADLRAPAVRYIRDGIHAFPYVPRVPGHDHDCSGPCLRDGNWMVIGCVARTELLRSAGGWQDWPMFEDFALWQRCWLLGATIEPVRGAIYRAHILPGSRNRTPSQAEKLRVHREIDAANLRWAAQQAVPACR